MFFSPLQPLIFPVEYLQRTMREMIVWFSLTFARHPNIVGSFGFVTNVSGGLGLVLPYFSNGGIMKYLDKNPDADRVRLVSNMPLLHYLFD